MKIKCLHFPTLANTIYFMKTVLIITILSLAAITITYAHPIHVSVVNMDYTADSNRIVYSIRLFYDDFQSLINFKYNTLLNFKGQSRMTTKEQQAVTDYISRNFILMDTNRETLSSEFTGWKVEDFSVWLYFSSDLNAELSSIIIKNTIMLDLFADQVNLVILHSDDIQKGFEFTKRITTHTYSP